MNIKYIVEISFSVSLFVNAVIFIPQALRILINKDTKNVSFTTFFGFWLIQLVTTLHGFLHQDYLLAYGTLLSMITCGYVIWLLVYYKVKNRHDKYIVKSH